MSTTTILLIVGGCVMAVLVVVVVLLAALLLPAVSSARTAARRSMSRNNLKQIGLATQMFSESRISLPAGGTYSPTGEGLHGWMTELLPYVEQANLYNQLDMKVPWNSAQNQSVFRNKVSMFLNPNVEGADTADGYASAHYAGNMQVLPKNKGLRMNDILDGMTRTILAGEVKEGFRPWGAPDNLRDPALGLDGPGQFGCPANESCQMLFMDGSVRNINKRIDVQTLKALATPAGGENVEYYE